MRRITRSLGLYALLVAALACASGGPPPELDALDEAPEFAATSEAVVGHYARSDPYRTVDVWLEVNGTARIRFVNSPTPESPFGSTHEYAGSWKIRNGWVHLRYDFGEVILQFSPAAPPDRIAMLDVAYAPLSIHVLNFHHLARVEQG